MKKNEIFKDVFVYNKALYFKKLEMIVIADLQIGQESYFASKGIFVPQFQTKIMIDAILNLIKETKAKYLLINGDFKHDFSYTSNQEWRDISLFLDSVLKKVKVIIVKGNHDNYLQNIANKFEIRIVNKLLLEGYLFIHGHSLPKEDNYDLMIIGHEQPAVILREGFEKFKLPCFLYGNTLDNKKIIVMPSFSPLSANSEINLQEKNDLLSPILKKMVELDKLKVFAIDEELGILKLPEIEKLKNYDLINQNL